MKEAIMNNAGKIGVGSLVVVGIYGAYRLGKKFFSKDETAPEEPKTQATAK